MATALLASTKLTHEAANKTDPALYELAWDADVAVEKGKTIALAGVISGEALDVPRLRDLVAADVKAVAAAHKPPIVVDYVLFPDLLGVQV